MAVICLSVINIPPPFISGQTGQIQYVGTPFIYIKSTSLYLYENMNRSYSRRFPASYVPAFTQTFDVLLGASWKVATNSWKAWNGYG